MTASEVVAAVQAVTVIVTAYHVWLVRSAYKSGAWVAEIDQRYTRIVTRVEQVESRLDRGGEKMSELASDVQGLESRLHDELRVHYVPIERFNDFLADSREFRAATRRELADLRYGHRRGGNSGEGG